MRSIRLSLIVYFLILLALALGAVSGFVYWTTAQTVAAKQQSTQELLLTQYEERCREERAKLDDALLYQARSLAGGLAQTQPQWNRLRMQGLLQLGLLSAGLNPNAQVLMPLWVAEGTPGTLAFRLHRIMSNDIQINEEDLTHIGDGDVTEYFQINSEWGNTWRSQSMEEYFFPFDPKQFARTALFTWKFDDTVIRPGVPLRRVTLKAPISRYRILWVPHRPPGAHADGRAEGRFEGRLPNRPEGRSEGNPGEPPSPRPPPERSHPSPTPAIFVQCACDTTRRDANLALIQADCDRELAKLETASAATLDSLRHQLLGISLTTFIATVAGGFWLVRLGLSPLQRLTEAVSRVSERDFRLQFEEPHLPAELRPIVERLTQALELLQRAFTREKQAAADISHELRTPLAALLTTTEVALRKARSPEEYRELLSDCRALGQQMSQLVERLLALARLDAGVDTLRKQEVDVTALAVQCAALVRPLAEARELRLQVHGSDPVVLTADPDKLREVITNLLHNAIEYNQPAGRVDMAVERRNGHLHVEVRDTGIGIPADSRERIFERFYRADPSREATGLHAGLGLAIVKGYVDLMGGSIAVESVEGQGSTFRVQLPA